MKELKKSDEDKHKDDCTKVREDGAYVEAGENDNLLVQKVSADPGTLGVLGYSFLEENADKVAPVDRRRRPDRSDDQRPELPGRAQALRLCEGRALPPSRRSRTSSPPTPRPGARAARSKRGLVPFGDADAAAATAQATTLTPLDPASLK